MSRLENELKGIIVESKHDQQVASVCGGAMIGTIPIAGQQLMRRIQRFTHSILIDIRIMVPLLLIVITTKRRFPPGRLLEYGHPHQATLPSPHTMKIKPYYQALLALAAAVILSNCAGTTPEATFTQPLAEGARISREDKVRTKVTSTDSKMLALDQQRMSEKITGKVQSIASSRSGPARNYELVVSINRYDKGDAFARAMLAGLGQIHIDGVVSVYQQPGKNKVAEFNLNKTFAWGGIYGASVTMDTIEDTYAAAVAQAVCQGK